MRKIKIIHGEYYHIYNRGNNKQPIFLDERDWIRFLFLIVHFQSQLSFNHLNRQTTYFVKHRVFNIPDKVLENIIKDRGVELVSFALMPNHFHLIMRELKEGGISRYMQKILNAYTKYFNAKYKTSGHLFQGPFRFIHIKDDRQLLYLSAYIHRNPTEIQEWSNRERLFPYSSYQDFIDINRWGELLKSSIVTEQFSDAEKYKSFVKTSGAKDSTQIFTKEILFD